MWLLSEAVRAEFFALPPFLRSSVLSRQSFLRFSFEAEKKAPGGPGAF